MDLNPLRKISTVRTMTDPLGAGSGVEHDVWPLRREHRSERPGRPQPGCRCSQHSPEVIADMVRRTGPAGRGDHRNLSRGRGLARFWGPLACFAWVHW